MWNVFHVAHVITLQRLTAGKHTAHWTGDNFSDFDSMASSVRQIMNHNMFGIAFVGADICGFLGMSSRDTHSLFMLYVVVLSLVRCDLFLI